LAEHELVHAFFHESDTLAELLYRNIDLRLGYFMGDGRFQAMMSILLCFVIDGIWRAEEVKEPIDQRVGVMAADSGSAYAVWGNYGADGSCPFLAGNQDAYRPWKRPLEWLSQQDADTAPLK
jgi:hypothetical protein